MIIFIIMKWGNNMKINFNRLRFFIFTFILMFTLGINSSFADTKVSVYIDDKPLTTDVDAVIKNGRTLVPFRAIFEALGADVQWIKENETVVGTKNGTTIMMKIGANSISVNGDIHKIDVAPAIIKSRTMVPVRFVSEYMGARVDWDSSKNTVYISTTGAPAPIIETPEIPTPPANNQNSNNNLIDICGTFAMQDVNKNQYVIYFKPDLTLDIKNIVNGEKMSGTYSSSGDSFSMVSPVINSNFTRKDVKYKNRVIVLMTDNTNSGKTFAITPISMSDYDLVLAK